MEGRASGISSWAITKHSSCAGCARLRRTSWVVTFRTPAAEARPPRRSVTIAPSSGGSSVRHSKAKGCTRLSVFPESSRNVASIPEGRFAVRRRTCAWPGGLWTSAGNRRWSSPPPHGAAGHEVAQFCGGLRRATLSREHRMIWRSSWSLGRPSASGTRRPLPRNPLPSRSRSAPRIRASRCRRPWRSPGPGRRRSCVTARHQADRVTGKP